MKKLLVYLKDYKKECVLGPLFKLLEASLELIVPLVIAAIIDKGVLGGNSPFIFKMGAVLIILAAVGLAFSVTAQYFAAAAAVGFVTKLRSLLFCHIQKLSYSELDRLGTSTILTRLSGDMNQLQNGVNLTLRLFLRSPFVVFGAMIMAFTINTRAALVFVAAIPVLAIIVFGIMMISTPIYKKVQSGLDKITEKVRENLGGARVIRALCRENEETAEFEAENEAQAGLQRLAGRISSLTNPLTYTAINLAVVWLIHIGAIKVNSGIITQGAVIALYNYMSQILVELIKLANLIVTITKAVACGNRIQNALEITPSVSDGEGASPSAAAGENAVSFENVTLRYHSSAAPALSNINFCVKAGETVGIIGGTGSGKTSLVNMIARFYDAESGSVKVFGTDVRTYRLKELREMIGIVPQKAVLFSGSIRQNMLWGKNTATDSEINRALEIAQAKEIVDKKDGGLDFEVEQFGRNLSGGQRQRLTIARALVKDPKILILDDSASALDFATDAALRSSLKEACVGITVFIVSQRTSSVMSADKIIVLENGEAVGIGSHSDLLENCEVYREIYNSQFKGGKGNE